MTRGGRRLGAGRPPKDRETLIVPLAAPALRTLKHMAEVLETSPQEVATGLIEAQATALRRLWRPGGAENQSAIKQRPVAAPDATAPGTTALGRGEPS